MDSDCIPVNVDLYGYKKASVQPPPTDQLDIAGVRCLRVVLRPHEPLCEVKLAGGHEIHISAWANKTDLSPACKHNADAEKLREDLKTALLQLSEERERCAKIAESEPWPLGPAPAEVLAVSASLTYEQIVEAAVKATRQSIAEKIRQQTEQRKDKTRP